MGLCYSDKKNNSTNQMNNITTQQNINVENAKNYENTTKKSDNQVNNDKQQYVKHSKNIFQHLNKTTVIKKIYEIKGEDIIIESCYNSVIIILDHSSDVIIQDCQNTEIFLGPCKNSIIVKNSEYLKIVCISSNFEASYLKNSKLSVFSKNPPKFRECKDIELGCFYFDYSGLSDLFVNCELDIWDNCYSEYENSKGIKLINTIDQSESFKNLKSNLFVDPDIVEKEYLSVPYTFGLLYDFNVDHFNMVIFFDSYSNLDEILNFCDPIVLEKEDCKLVKTINFNNKSRIISKIRKQFDENLNFFEKEKFIGLWIVCNKYDNFYFLNDYLNQKFEGNFYAQFEEKEKNLQLFLESIFNLKK